MLTINKPVTLVLEPQEIACVLDSLAERPYKLVQPLFDKIVARIIAEQQPAEAAPAAE